MLKIFMIVLLSFLTTPTSVTSHASLVLVGIDSLTQKSSGNGSGYIIPLRKKLVDQYGDGGIGWIGFDRRGVEFTGYDFSTSANVKQISDLKTGVDSYSFDNKGSYTENGNNDSVNINFQKSWDIGKIFYLIQPDGGTFEVNGIQVNTTGELKLGEIPVPADSKINITHMNGKVTIYGGLLLNQTGVAVSRVAFGGTRLDMLLNNDSFRKQWLDALNPDLFLLNSGAPESHEKIPVEVYHKNLLSFIKPYVDKNIKMIIIRPNQWKDMPVELDQYGVIQEQVAKDNGLFFVNNRYLFGKDFQEYKKNGYMEEEYHPNDKGNVLIVQNILEKAGAYIDGSIHKE